MKAIFVVMLCVLTAASVAAADAPPPEAFQILPAVGKEGPVITPYLRYQTEMGWRQDDARRAEWQGIRTEEDLLRVQRKIEEHLLAMLGGLPKERTALNPQITGKISMDGFHIEKLIFESLPGVYVTALVYVPEDGGKKHPAILVPVGHATNGKVHYQALCQRLVKRGYVVICWDPPGQAERSQFWDPKAGKSRYNLICAEHAVMGNLAYLAGTNLARWEVWDGIRAVDYLLTRQDVDPERVNITGTSGGGFQAAHIAALDHRIKVAVPSCYITSLPMRMYNRIFKDPDSDPEQDLYGMVSNHVDLPGLLLAMYPRPVFIAAAVLDFFPIEGVHKTVREVTAVYSQFNHADRIGMAEGYHDHQFSPENQEAAMAFLDHFNRLPARREPTPIKELDEKSLQCTRSGQVMVDFPNARSIMDEIRDYYRGHKGKATSSLKDMYFSPLYPNIRGWNVAEFQGAIPGFTEIRWEKTGSSEFAGVTIDKYVLYHSRVLELPLLYMHKTSGPSQKTVLWLGEKGKSASEDWPNISKHLDEGNDVISFDPRGMGETRMPYKAISPDDPALAQLDFDHAYVNPLSGVLADYGYNALLSGRPYFLQMIEDAEIATRFFKGAVNPKANISVTGTNGAYTLASAVSETLPSIKLISQPGDRTLQWSELVEQKTELWPIQYLLPGGAYVH